MAEGKKKGEVPAGQKPKGKKTAGVAAAEHGAAAKAPKAGPKHREAILAIEIFVVVAVLAFAVLVVLNLQIPIFLTSVCGACPEISLPAEWCKGGRIAETVLDECGCRQMPNCIPKESPGFSMLVCGNGKIDAGEVQANCCTDVGCPEGKTCKDNYCQETITITPGEEFDLGRGATARYKDAQLSIEFVEFAGLKSARLNLALPGESGEVTIGKGEQGVFDGFAITLKEIVAAPRNHIRLVLLERGVFDCMEDSACWMEELENCRKAKYSVGKNWTVGGILRHGVTVYEIAGEEGGLCRVEKEFYSYGNAPGEKTTCYYKDGIPRSDECKTALETMETIALPEPVLAGLAVLFGWE